MKFKNAFLENGRLNIIPRQNKILILILGILLVFTFPVTILLIIHIFYILLEEPFSFNMKITFFHFGMIFFNFLILLGLSSLRGFKKIIPEKFTIDSIFIQIDYGKNQIYKLRLSLFTHYGIMEERRNRQIYYKIFLINKFYNIYLELISTTDTEILKLITEYINSINLQQISENIILYENQIKIIHFKNYLNMEKYKDQLIFPENMEKFMLIKNRSRRFFPILYLLIIIHSFLFLLIQIFFNSFVKIDIFSIIAIFPFFIIFSFIYFLILRQIVLTFFDTKIYINGNQLFIEKHFFLPFIKFKFLEKQFLLIDDFFASQLYLSYEKISFIKFYDHHLISEIKSLNIIYFWNYILKSIKIYFKETKIDFYNYSWFEILHIYNSINYMCRQNAKFNPE